MSHRRLSVTLKIGSRRLPALLCALLLMSCCFGLLRMRAQDVPSDKKPAEPKKEEGLILKSGGKVKFTTDEGTWMSLDLSPDGKMIVFDLLGDLYTLPVTGGEAKRIIGEMSFESQPKFSPDGQSIVFISDRSGAENLWVCKPDGTGLKAITKGRGQAMQMFVSPSWTADGKYIIASKADRSLGTYHVYLYHVDGGGGVSLGPPPPPPPTPGQQGPPAGPALNKMGAIASADGKYVYYAQRTGGFSYNAQFPLWQIIRFDRETSETMNLTNARGSAMRPLLSPDGRHLVYATRFQTRTALRVRDLETSDERWLIDNVTRDDQESRATRDTFPGYAFFPDGKSLLITAGGKIQRVDFATGQATIIPFTARVDMDIAPRLYKQYKVDDGPTVRARLIRYPKLSPDGKRLTFTSFNKVYYCELPNCTPKRLTDLTVGEFMPAWSPDGRYIAFATWTREGGHIYRATPGQGPAERLTQRAAFYTSPVYTPDNSKIVFVTGSIDDQLYADLREQGFSSEEEAILHGHDPNSTAGEISGVAANAGLELKYIPAAGGDAIVIGPAQGGRYPHFAQDSNRVYLTTGQGLTSLRLDGFDRRTHLRITGSGMPPGQATASQIVISPSGDQAFAEVQGKHFLVTIPKVGKETVQVSVAGATSTVPVKKMSAEGGDFLAWTSDG
jgi:Tol biopolymer transport system component